MNRTWVNKREDDEWSEKAVEEAAKRNRASWREDCIRICKSDAYSSDIHDLASRLVNLIDETECMYHGGPLKLKEIGELANTLDELRMRLQSM